MLLIVFYLLIHFHINVFSHFKSLQLMTDDINIDRTEKYAISDNAEKSQRCNNNVKHFVQVIEEDEEAGYGMKGDYHIDGGRTEIVPYETQANQTVDLGQDKYAVSC